MANEEHLQIIRQGVDVWNEWRQKNPELVPDLSGAHPYEANFSGTDLGEAILRGVCAHQCRRKRTAQRQNGDGRQKTTDMERYQSHGNQCPIWCFRSSSRLLPLITP